MRIADICTRHVVHIGATASLREAAETMRTRHVGTVVVVDQPNGERVPIGIVTDRDLVVAVVAEGVDPGSLTVADVMSRRVATCMEDQDMFEAIEIMRERGVRRLPVLNAKGGLAGIVAADDIFGALGECMRDLGRALTRAQAHEMEART
ncbi:MAG: CBS domain-containing protein [Rhodanobacteraceae bacterium]|jgi:CBS-domain-containing membrane protein|nr:CBS domain-containing protein [Rhodanobacteraceae bacterium]